MKGSLIMDVEDIGDLEIGFMDVAEKFQVDIDCWWNFSFHVAANGTGVWEGDLEEAGFLLSDCQEATTKEEFLTLLGGVR